MINLVCLYGVGDAYLVCALHRSFQATHGIQARVVVKSSQAVVPEMFGVPFVVDDALVQRAEGDADLQRNYPNVIADGATFYVHPHFVRTGARLDQLTVKARVSQADMYRALLHLSPWATLAHGRFDALPVTRDVVLITQSRSWPNLPPEFWTTLADRLRAARRSVDVVDPGWSLRELFAACSGANNVIGPQCGVMSVLCEIGFPCRKTFAVRMLSEQCPYLFGLEETLPYGDTATFAGRHHTADLIVVSPDWSGAVEAIVSRNREK